MLMVDRILSSQKKRSLICCISPASPGSNYVGHGVAASVNVNATFDSPNACPVVPAAGVRAAAAANPAPTPTPTPIAAVVGGNQLARGATAMVVA
ncbi:unnamed protein product [Linum trigynum]|uniref:Uncharacterized protein n=1 Tax=Linum trigynum TaxID=586398 RepID=A0AAV2FMQ5_9ROSI